MSLFGDAFGTAQTALDVVFGETVKIDPQITGASSKYLKRGVDPNVPPYELVGIFSDASIVDTVKGSGANTHENVDVLTRLTAIDFDQALFATLPIPQEGWVLVAIEQPRLPRYSIISSGEPDGVSRISCRITFLDYAQT